MSERKSMAEEVLDNQTQPAAGHAEAAVVKFDAIDAIAFALDVLTGQKPIDDYHRRARASLLQAALHRVGFVLAKAEPSR